MFVTLATAYPIGEKCKEWLKQNLPVSWEYTDDPDKSDCFFSVFSKKLLSKEFIEKRPCWNFHLGRLPEWKGVGIIPQLIIQGEKQTGVTLHKIDETIDGGEIIDINFVNILITDTGEELFNKCCDALFEIFKQWSIKLIMRDYFSIKQEMQPKIYTHKDMEELKDLTKFVRAFTFSGKENAYYYNIKGEKIYLKYD